VEDLPTWRRPLLVVARSGRDCHNLDEVLSFFIDAGAHPALLCLTPEETAIAGSPDTASARDRACRTGGVADRVEALHVHGWAATADESGASGQAPRALAEAISTAVQAHFADGVLSLNLSHASDHPLHHWASEASLTAAAQLGIHAFVDPCLPKASAG
jgi:hypothetical protein